jgi:hypothetical protein
MASPTLCYIYVHYFNETCNILQYLYHDICRLIVTYFSAVSFIEPLVLAP